MNHFNIFISLAYVVTVTLSIIYNYRYIHRLVVRTYVTAQWVVVLLLHFGNFEVKEFCTWVSWISSNLEIWGSRNGGRVEKDIKFL